MADGKIKISELDEALQLSDNAEFPYTQDNGGVPTTFKAPANQIARKVAEGSTFTNLTTTAKTLVGAINELKALGSPILLGTTAPTSSQGADGNIYIQYTAGTGGADDEVDGIYVKINGAWCEISTGGGSGTTDYDDLSNKPQVNSVELVGNKSLDDLGIMPASLSKTVSGSIASFTDGADNIPVKSLVSEIVAVESGSGEKSPDNPYSISGFDSGIITRCGKNLFDHTQITNASGWSESGGVYSGTIGNLYLYARNGFPIQPKWVPNQQYVFKLKVNNAEGNSRFRFVYTDNTYSDLVITSSSVGSYISIITEINKTISNLIFFYNLGGNLSISEMCLELGTSASTFEAYNGNTYTFEFGQTVYGGHFDNKGNLVITHNIIDMGSLNWSYSENNNWFQVAKPSGAKLVNNMDMLCSCYINNGTSASLDISIFQATSYIRVKDSNYTDANVFKTAVTGQKIVYELANPITLSITSQDIPTLLGENNIYSNCGDVEVEYYTYKSDDIVDLIKSVGTGGFQPVIYSEEEREIGVWVDGKPLYQKTYEIDVSTLVAVSDWTTIDSTINGETMAGMEISVKSYNDYSSRSIAFRTDYVDPIPRFTIIQGAFKYFTDSSTFPFNNYVWTITLRYTKTTDTAGSGQWTPQGVPAHHYSEDEQVVGTWIDGSTIYERTFDFGSDINISYNSWTETSVSWQTLNVDRLAGAEGFTSSGGTYAGTLLASKKSNGNIEIQTPRNGTDSGVRYLTIRYTKSST